MTINAFTDGTSRGNPGHSGIGFLLKNENGDVIHSEHDYIGIATNNIAEYTALLRCLELVQLLNASNPPLQCTSLVVYSDSELMVEQVNGRYKTKNEQLKKRVAQIHQRLKTASFAFAIKHIPREFNAEADRLANRGIDLRQ